MTRRDWLIAVIGGSLLAAATIYDLNTKHEFRMRIVEATKDCEPKTKTGRFADWFNKWNRGDTP